MQILFVIRWNASMVAPVCLLDSASANACQASPGFSARTVCLHMYIYMCIRLLLLSMENGLYFICFINSCYISWWLV